MGNHSSLRLAIQKKCRSDESFQTKSAIREFLIQMNWIFLADHPSSNHLLSRIDLTS